VVQLAFLSQLHLVALPEVVLDRFHVGGNRVYQAQSWTRVSSQSNVLNVKNILLSIALASTLWGLARAQITGKNQSTIVRDGNYVELEKMPNISPDDPRGEWFHENTLVVRNDEAILDKVPIVVHNGEKEYSASDGGFLTFRAKFLKKDADTVIVLRMCQSDYIVWRINPRDRYKEIKTYPIKSSSDQIEFQGVTYKMAEVEKTKLRGLIHLLDTEPLEKK
jgi:hypothetical protein